MHDLNKLIAQPELFKELELPEQLSIVADLKLLCDNQETEELEAGNKLGAKRWKDRADYWKSTGQNIKKLAELEIASRRMGL